MSSRTYSKALDFEIESIQIASLRKDDVGDDVIIHHGDISRWLGISIYEDLFRNFMTCEIFISDQDGFFLNRFRTDEVIVIKFTTPDLEGYEFEPRLHYFYLYKIDPVVIVKKPPGAFYVLKGVSFEHFYNTLRTFSKSYKGKTHEIATKIYKEHLLAKSNKTIQKSFTCGRPTKHDMMFTFPYVNPVDAINHLASVSVDSVNPDICNYVFFENKNGFNFTSITELIEKPRKIHKYVTSIPFQPGETLFDFAKHYNKTIKIVPLKSGDKVIDTLDGVHGEYFAEYDIVYKTYKPFLTKEKGKGSVEGKRYLNYFPKTTHLNKQPLLSKENILFENPLGRNRVCFTNGALFSEEKKLSPTESEWKLYETHEGEYSFQRRSMMQQINGFTVEVTVPGNSEITVGDIFELDSAVYRTDDPDKYLRGRYLVTAVNHYMTISQYTTVVTISRDSIVSNDFDDETEAGE